MLSGRPFEGSSSLGGVRLVTMAMSPATTSVMCKDGRVSSDGFQSKRKLLILTSAPSVSINHLSPSKPSISVPFSVSEEILTPNHDGILYKPKRKPDSVPTSQPIAPAETVNTPKADRTKPRNRRFFALWRGGLLFRRRGSVCSIGHDIFLFVCCSDGLKWLRPSERMDGEYVC